MNMIDIATKACQMLFKTASTSCSKMTSNRQPWGPIMNKWPISFVISSRKPWLSITYSLAEGIKIFSVDVGNVPIKVASDKLYVA